MGTRANGIAFKTEEKEIPFLEIAKIIGDDYFLIDSISEIGGYPRGVHYFSVEYYENSIWIYGHFFFETFFRNDLDLQKQILNLLFNPKKVIGFEEVSACNASAFCIFENGKKIRQREFSTDLDFHSEWGVPLEIEAKFQESPKQKVRIDRDYYMDEYSISHKGKSYKILKMWLTQKICQLIHEEEFGFSPVYEYNPQPILKSETYISRKEYEKLVLKKEREDFERNHPFLSILKRFWEYLTAYYLKI